MNFHIFRKLMALPLNSSERAVTTAIVYHVTKDGDSSFPSYETIHKESGVSNKTISKVIRTLRYAGILDWKHRASINTGKESNEYRFKFEGIRFNRLKLNKTQYEDIKSKLKTLRKKVVAEMDAESRAKKRDIDPVIPSKMLRGDTVTNVTKSKSQSVKYDARAVTGPKGSTIPSQFSSIPSEMLRRSNNDIVPTHTDCTNLNREVPNKSQNQKRFGKMISGGANTRKTPYEQTNEEWLADYEDSRGH